jgi:hypothetical protein
LRKFQAGHCDDNGRTQAGREVDNPFRRVLTADAEGHVLVEFVDFSKSTGSLDHERVAAQRRPPVGLTPKKMPGREPRRDAMVRRRDHDEPGHRDEDLTAATT